MDSSLRLSNWVLVSVTMAIYGCGSVKFFGTERGQFKYRVEKSQEPNSPPANEPENPPQSIEDKPVTTEDGTGTCDIPGQVRTPSQNPTQGSEQDSTKHCVEPSQNQVPMNIDSQPR